MTVDVAIVGAGPAGCAMALELARLGRRAVVVAGGKGAATIGECLPPAANRVLRQLRLPAPDPALHLPSVGHASSWGSPDVETDDFIANPYGHGWHLDRARFDAALRATLESRGVPLLDAAPAASWLADGTGRGSAVASRRGARIRSDDRLVAFVATAQRRDDDDRDATTFTEAVPEGWWYTARLTHGRRVLAFHTDGDLPACRAARDRGGFLRLLEQSRHVKHRLCGYAFADHVPAAVPAGGRWLAQAFGDGWIAVGDAAQCYDPLSSQGLIDALETGMRAAFAVHAGLDGDRRHLRRYQTMLELRRMRYERLRRQAYGLERRWRESPFWRRRHSSRSAGPP